MCKRVLQNMIGMLLLVLVSSCGATGASTQSVGSKADVQIRLADFSIASSRTTLTPGVPYHLVVTNAGTTVHELMLMPPMAMGSMPMDQMDKLAIVAISNVAPGTTKTLDVTIPSSATTGPLEFSCHLPGHYEAGMKLAVSVQ
ncbi:MAG: hypothetical protein H0X37_08245 [Herpetosiphonaceae bacterium]|nr:hypothetical protein [Herpetosiphonaceae bacterium]